MQIPLFQIDAFAERVFSGNPAAVCPLVSWLPDAVMQAVAAENNLSETAFFVPQDDGYAIRWFTPRTEVDLCGHATLASAHVVLRHLTTGRTAVRFSSQSGPLAVHLAGDLLALDFPSRPPVARPAPAGLAAAVGGAPRETLFARDAMLVYATEDEVRALRPDFARLAALDLFGVIVTAPGRDVDFVSRYFAPREGIPEDPVTGSAHCTLVPYWAQRLRRTTLRARQVSERGGDLFCEDRGDRVSIAGRAVTYLEGTIDV
ncbi:MAG: PhzF family phenazine biosynthesis protein [Deltaproteobacteria bacterium]|nr:PhzF family phenazine biosynthesis protein [Deltaproteobacteria bacterium]